jgi:glycosyltransferase involved in cell wall biosynthesis
VTRYLAPPVNGPLEPGPRPTFSVLIAVYNAAHLIGEAIESALRQTFPALEIVVCDDGSTDELDSALDQYRDEIVLLRKEHGGEGSAKNVAAAAASGEFVVILDADDVFLPTRLEALAELAVARPDLDILTTDAYLTVDGRPVRRCYEGGWTFPVRDQRKEILRRNFVFGLAAARRELVVDDGGFDERILWTTDWDRWLRLVLQGCRAGAVAEPLALYRLRETSLSARRGDLLRGKIATLEKARVNSALLSDERIVLEDALAGYRRELALCDLRQSLADREPRARRRALELASSRGSGFRQRGWAAAAALAPGVAGRLERARAERFWTGAGGIRVERREVSGQTRLRVAIYTDAPTLGGAERSLANLVAALSPSIDVAVLGVERGVVDAIAAGRREVRTYVLPFVTSRRDLSAIRAHLRVLIALCPNVFQANLISPWSSQMAIFLALVLPGARVVAVEQLPTPPPTAEQRRLKRLTSRRLSAHVAVSEHSAREVENIVGLPRGSVRTIYNGVPDRGGRRRPPRPQAGPTVGALGRLEPQKGFDVLIRALPRLPDVTAVLVGEGSERARLERLAADLGVSERVRLMGWADDPTTHLETFEILVLPSRFEGFPLAVVEAMLAELPVVATDVGGVREAVLHGETGMLVPPDDPEALAGALRELLDDAQLRRAMGRRGRALALDRYTAAVMAKRFESLYDEICT